MSPPQIEHRQIVGEISRSVSSDLVIADRH